MYGQGEMRAELLTVSVLMVELDLLVILFGVIQHFIIWKAYSTLKQCHALDLLRINNALSIIKRGLRGLSVIRFTLPA